MKPLRVSVSLATPIALGKTFFTLDAVLFGILSELRETGQSSLDPLPNIPVEKRDGVYLATRAFFETPVETDEVKIGGLRPVKDLQDAPSRFRTNRKRFPKVTITRGTTKAHLSRYRIISPRTIYWDAVGDASKIEALFLRTRAIGALRKDGHGEVADVQITPLSSPDIILDDTGQVTRPIPRDVVERWGLNTTSLSAIDTWAPPYWDTENRAECCIPTPI